MERVIISLLFAFGLLLVINKSYATAQEPDILIYKGKIYYLHTNPLEGYFKKYPDKKPKTSIISSGNWRGYVATFELIDSTLFLRDIEIEIDDGKHGLRKTSVLEQVFPGEKVVSLEWFCGLLTVPYGELINYVHMGYSSTFENYMIFEIRNGNLTKERELKYEGYIKFKEKQFELFKQTNEYKEILSVLRKQFKSTDERLEAFMKINATEYMTYIIEE